MDFEFAGINDLRQFVREVNIKVKKQIDAVKTSINDVNTKCDGKTTESYVNTLCAKKLDKATATQLPTASTQYVLTATKDAAGNITYSWTEKD